MSCADVQTIQAGNGTKTQFSFDFPYIFKSEIRVYLWNATTKEWDEKLTTDATYPWQVTDANPTIVEFTGTAPPLPAVPTDPGEPTVDNVRIRRITNIDDIRALFNPGSAIRSDDLNKNFEQLRYAIQEANCQGVSDDVDAHLREYYWSKFDNAVYSGETWISNDATLSTTGRIDERLTELKTSGYWDDRYYTETELNGGQLDNRYYTETELNAGQLDNRYYTETETLQNFVQTQGSVVYVAPRAFGWSGTDQFVPTQLNISDYLTNKIETSTDPVTTSDTAIVSPGYLDQYYYKKSDTWTRTEADDRYYNINTESIKSTDTWTPTDGYVATTAAIDARIINLVDEVGGFVPIPDHTQFPLTSPDIADHWGTVVSIQDITGLTHNGLGASTNATKANGDPITILGIPASLPSPVPSTLGMLVQTTALTESFNQYLFHRLTPEVNDVITVAQNATEIATVAGEITPFNNVGTVAAISPQVATVAGNVSSVITVASNNTDISTVAGINSDVTTVAGVSTNVTNVANNTANINTVAGQIAPFNNVGTVAAISPQVATVAGNVSNVLTVASNISDVNTVATDITDVTAVSTNIGAVAAVGSDLANSFSNIDDYGGITDPVTSTPAGTSDIQTVATNISNVNTVAAINAGVTTVAGISANVTTVAGNTANINAVAADATDIGTVATNITNVNAVGTDIASVNTAATNISAIIAAPTEATNAAASASAAATSETNAAASETNAANSASAAATSESNAATSASNAATSETNALASATAAASSAAAALVSETNADNSADLALQYRDDTAGILAQADSDPYTVSTNQSWGDIITGAVSHFANEVLADILLTMSKGTNTYDYGTL